MATFRAMWISRKLTDNHWSMVPNRWKKTGQSSACDMTEKKNPHKTQKNTESMAQRNIVLNFSFYWKISVGLPMILGRNPQGDLCLQLCPHDPSLPLILLHQSAIQLYLRGNIGTHQLGYVQIEVLNRISRYSSIHHNVLYRIRRSRVTYR